MHSRQRNASLIASRAGIVHFQVSFLVKDDTMHTKTLTSLLILLFCVATTSDVSGQSPEPSAPHASAEWQIWAYSTAAPTFIAMSATIVDAASNVLRNGTNEWTCMPANPRGMANPADGWADAQEAMPICADEEGLKWILAYVGGTTPQLTRDTYLWMLHGDMGEDNSTPLVMTRDDAEDPANWIMSGPHLMLMPREPSSLDAFTTDFRTGSPYLMFGGTEYAHLMIPMEDYYQHQQP